MWSEHCFIQKFYSLVKEITKRRSSYVVEAGEENGLVDIGDGLTCFKIESHNHPSALEPYQGGATGVGGINRDIFTMGKRIVLLQTIL